MTDCLKHQLTTAWARFDNQPEQYLRHLECKVCMKKLKAVDVIKIFGTILEERAEMINDLIE